MAKNRTCTLCGKKYSYCPTCSADLEKPSWYALWDSENCMKLDDILVRHTLKKITTDEAKNLIIENKLDTLAISDNDIKKHYNEILGIVEKIEVAEVEPVSKETVKVEETVIEKKVEDKIENKVETINKPAFNNNFKKKK